MPTLYQTSISTYQRGISLVIVLIFLAILSILGVTGMQNSTFASRIAGNEADRTLAFQAAEAALRDAENDIKGLNYLGVNCATPYCRADPIYRGNGFGYDCNLGRCVQTVGAAPVWETTSVWDINSATSVVYGEYTKAGAGAADRPTMPVVARQPRYILEYFNQGDYAVYRVTAVGFGANETTRAMLQAAVKVKPI